MIDMTKNEIFIFLEKIRKSGLINMLGATPYIQKEFGLSKERAHKILHLWITRKPI